MKKPTKPSAGKSGVPKHAKSSAKPVTIDLKAEKVAPNETATPKKAAVKTSVPKASGKSEAPKAGASSTQVKDKPDDKTAQPNTKPDSTAKNPANKGAEAKQTAKATPPVKSAGTKGRFTAAVIGGVVALAGAALLQTAGIIPPGSSSKTGPTVNLALEQSQKNLAAKIEVLEKQLGSTAAPDDINLLIDKKLAKLAPASKPTVALDDVTTQVNETTIRVEKLQSEVEMITSTISGLNKIPSSGGAGDDAAIASLNAKLDDVLQKLQSYSTDIESLKTQTTNLASQSGAPSAELEKTTNAIADLQESLSGRLNDIESKTISLSGSMDKLRQQADKFGTANNETAQAIAAAVVKSDVDRGLSFTQSLATLTALSGDDENLTLLKGFAEKGVPTAVQLAQQFDALRPEILATLVDKPAEDLTSRLLAGAKSMVKIQSLNPDTSNGPEVLIADIGSALVKSDLAAAVKNWGALPQAAKDISVNWHKDIQARIAVDGLISKAVQSYLISTATQ